MGLKFLRVDCIIAAFVVYPGPVLGERVEEHAHFEFDGTVIFEELREKE